MPGENNSNIILGAGLAGLGAAYYSGFPVYEQGARAGGVADSVCKGGFVFDFGIHVLHSNDMRFHDLLKEVGLELVDHERRAYIYSYGSYTCYPFQVNSSHLPLMLRIRCVFDFLTRRANSLPADYEQWMIHNFGEGFARTFLIPYAEKFWRVLPKNMTYDWTNARVPQPSTVEVIKGAFLDTPSELGPNARFRYPSKDGAGFAGLAQALASRIDNIRCGMKATAVDIQNKKVIFNGDGEVVSYDNLITTIPLPELIGLIPDVPSEIRQTATRLKCNSIAIINFGVDSPDITDKHWIHFPEKDISFFRISFPDNFCPGLRPDGTSSIQAEVSYDKDSPPDTDELLTNVHNDLLKVGVLNARHRVGFQDVIYLKYAYVVYDHDRKDNVAQIHEYLNKHNVYPCGRYGAWEYQWSDEAILSGMETAKKLLRP